ncbi:DUF255 domain-containing protein [Bacillus velezensis]|nr:DUF255 domain-containing protein [Bacillus velezensis]QEQ55121.1 DUF255 domain-containing protein [Bacillus amyloliquefaciens]NOL16620.1 DUF255 domain-containing protein [Bacillus velezensis]QBK82007.1 DUF255 domain-containing protein [Bacillus velezensis]QOZ93765.1 DUF255 domain-containing protein [Bacillus velezensis]
MLYGSGGICLQQVFLNKGNAHNPVNWHPWGEEAFETQVLKRRTAYDSIFRVKCHLLYCFLDKK